MSNQYGSEVEIDLRAVFGAIFRRLPFLILFAVLVGAGVFYLLSKADPSYRAETTLLIETGEPDPTRQETAAATATLLDQQGISSQVQLIRSRDIALAVIRQLDLVQNPEFDPALQEPSIVDRALGLVGLGGEDGTAPPAEEVVLTDFLSRLTVNEIAQTRVISISFVAADPQLAADVANAVAAQYIAQQRDLQRRTTAVATDWLQTEIAALSNRVEAAERDVETFRAQSNLFRAGQNDVTITTQRLADISTQLAGVRTDRAEAEARAELIRATLESGRSLSSLEMLNSPLIQRLREQEAALRSQIAEASATLLPTHPRLRELNAQLVDVEASIRTEAANVLEGFETEAELARANEAELTQAQAELRTAAAESNQAEVQLRALERVATAERELLETYLALSREAVSRQNADYAPVNVRTVSVAAAPIAAYFPKPVSMSIVAMIVAFMLGAALLLVRELASGRATRPTVVPLMPVVPDAGVVGGRVRWSDGGDVRRMMPRDPGGTQSLSAQVEQSLSAIASQIRRKNAERILITMSEGTADQGRPLAGVALARTLARMGTRVLLVDLHGDDADRVAMGATATLPGFGELFGGEASFAQVIFRDRSSPAHFIPAGRRRRLGDLTEGDRLTILLGVLDHTYDHVVYDIGDEMIPVIGPSATAAVLVSEAGPDDPRTEAAHAAIRAASAAEIMLLITDPMPGVGTGKGAAA